MKLETVKTFILTILIGISILLFFAISNYQPNFDPLQSNYVGEVDIGGEELNKQSVIQPNSLVIHVADRAYSFEDKNEKLNLYENMQEWLLSDFSLTNPPSNHNSINKFELSFPISIPLAMLPSLFDINDGLNIPDWSFKEIVMTVDESSSTVNIYFLEHNGEEAAKFTVSDSDAFGYVLSLVQDEQQLIPCIAIAFGPEHDRIYIPQQEIEMERRSLAIETIDPALLVNALFTNPSFVNHTIGENTYNDGQRGMTVLNDGRSMEFINPIHANDQINFFDLMELSINQINEHFGWTNDYYLADFDMNANRLQYQMYYDGYPVYSHHDYSVIEQQWRNQELYQYKRPLFKLTNVLNSETTILPSGAEVMNYLYEEGNYDREEITDIQIGYRLKYEDDPYSVVLDPAWYIQYNDSWFEIRMSSSESLESEDA